MNNLERDLQKFLTNFTENLEEEFEGLAEDVEDRAKDLCPVATGALQDSIEFKTEKNDDEIGIKINEDKLESYWDEIEYGTSKQRPQPYIRPALKYGLKNMSERLQNAFKNSK